MRIIAGRLGGRQFASPRSYHTHPMSEKARSALFNILGDITGLSVLDAFAGSGALSFEAISRGAVSSIAIDNDRAAQRTIAANIDALHLAAQVTLIKASANGWHQTNTDTRFDLVLCDPPHDDLQTGVLRRLAVHVRPGGLFVVSWPSHMQPLDLPDLAQVEQRAYAGMQLLFYRG